MTHIKIGILAQIDAVQQNLWKIFEKGFILEARKTEMMNITRSANPALNKNTFTGFTYAEGTAAMTIQGTVNKVAIMLLLVLGGAWYTWRMAYGTIKTDPVAASQAMMPWMIGGGIGGFIMAMVTIFKRTWAGITGPIYAVLEGLFLGGISAFFEARYPGIVIQAVGLTFAILFALLFAYKTKIIKPTQNFRLGVFAATGGVMMLYLVSFLLNIFGVDNPAGFDSFCHRQGEKAVPTSNISDDIAVLKPHKLDDLIRRFPGDARIHQQYARKLRRQYLAGNALLTFLRTGNRR